MVAEGLAGTLRGVTGPAYVVTDPAVTAAHARDWTGRFAGTADLVVAPADTAEVSRVLAACAEHGVPVVPVGGNTGLVGGAVPDAGQVVLDLRRLGGVVVDELGRHATAGAGTTIAALHGAAAGAGLRYGVDLASRDSATIGGTVATNAGGVRAMRHGDTRAQLLGVEAVLADGTVVSHLSGLTRDNTGYHLPSLLCGSEGTLAVVTRVQVRLVAARPNRLTALLAFAGVRDAVAAVPSLAGSPFVELLELVLPAGLDLVVDVTGLPAPFRERHGAYLVVEAAAPAGVEIDAQAVATAPGVVDVAAAVDAADRARLLAYRERHTESIATLGDTHKLDVSLPLATLADFVGDVPAAVARLFPGARVWLFGHVADGNVHVNVTGVPPDDTTVDDAVLRMVAERGGSISAEHGVGRAKQPWLRLARSPAELAVFARIKQAFDPAGLLNPGVRLY